MPAGSVVGLQRIAAHRAEPERLDEARFREDWGVEGDHHARAGRSRQVVVAEAEVLGDLGLPAGAIREQLTISDAGELSAGTILEIGTVRLELVTPRVPCRVMDTVRPGLERELRGRGGWCARVLAGGDVRIGDAVRRTDAGEPAWILDYLVARAAWEAVPTESRTLPPGLTFREQLSQLTAGEERAVAAIDDGMSLDERTPDGLEAAAIARAGDASVDLWDLHDRASTALVKAAKLNPAPGRVWTEFVTATYRTAT
jgi:MOSC domain-containing protein YiiM